jgi:3-oxoadipate enol-lactonase
MSPSTVILLHAGIADSRMWKPQQDALSAAGFRVLAPDLQGFGERRLAPEPFSHARDILTVLDEPAVVVGSSLGGRVALEVAVLRPDLTERLVVLSPGLPGWSWSEEVRAGWAKEEDAFGRGDFEQAAEAALEVWLDRPGVRDSPAEPTMRAHVRQMLVRSYEQQATAWDEGAVEEDALDPPIQHRLGEIPCPTLVVVGELDVPDMQAIAGHVAESIPGASLVTIPGAAHLPSLEVPDRVNPHLLEFVRQP